MARAKSKEGAGVAKELRQLELAKRAAEVAALLGKEQPVRPRVDLTKLSYVPVEDGLFRSGSTLVLHPCDPTAARIAYDRRRRELEEDRAPVARVVNVEGLCFHGLRVCGGCLSPERQRTEPEAEAQVAGEGVSKALEETHA